LYISSCSPTCTTSKQDCNAHYRITTTQKFMYGKQIHTCYMTIQSKCVHQTSSFWTLQIINTHRKPFTIKM
uniref:Ovule protein n=1 Tax=Brugia timori TaxID=42155 RepID=A0A0R3QBI7_9BILA